MKELYPLQGIVTVLNTPFDKKNHIDLKALKRNTEKALKAGVAGFLVPAMASEVHLLSLKEKLTILDCVLKTVDGNVPVFAGTGSTTFDNSKKTLRSYLDLGCKQVLFQLPYANDDQFKTDFYELAELGPEVIMLQDWDASGYGLSDELIMELFEAVPAFRCLKVETVPAGIKYSTMIRLSENRLHVSGGWAVMQMPEGLQRGVHAFMPTAMHHIYVKIFNDFHGGKTEEALSLFNEILPVLAFSNQHLDISIFFFKRLLWKQGIYPTPNLRISSLSIDAILTETADRLIEKVTEIENRIGA
jgi:dihydrodipicolinate synthase/N-acetylneuraminate lyase